MFLKKTFLIYGVIFITPRNYIGLYLPSCHIFIYIFFTYDFNAYMFYLSYLFAACIIISCLYLVIIHDGCKWHFPLSSLLSFWDCFLGMFFYLYQTEIIVIVLV